MMKEIIVLPVLIFCFSFTSLAQHPNIGCIDKAIKLQAEDYQLGFAKQGMVVYRDAMVSMNSGEPFPITVSLVKGRIYQFIFIGSKESSKIMLELFDEKDKKIAQKATQPVVTDRNSNCVLYSFIPGKTDLYLIVLSQMNKGKTMCGSFTILQKGETQAADSTQKAPVKTNPRYLPRK